MALETDSTGLWVSIHAPVRGATLTSSPPTRLVGPTTVSIHAPVRGATANEPCGDFTLAIVVSIHAPVRGATSRRRRTFYGAVSFNPRPRAGGDGEQMASSNWKPIREKFQSTPPCGGRLAMPFGICTGILVVSIHAPVRGATSYKDFSSWRTVFKLFQSTPPCGGRPIRRRPETPP